MNTKGQVEKAILAIHQLNAILIGLSLGVCAPFRTPSVTEARHKRLISATIEQLSEIKKRIERLGEEL